MYPTLTRDDGLRNFLLGVYGKMAVSLLLTALLAYLSTQAPLAELIHGVDANGKPSLTIIGLVIAFSPLALILIMGLTGASSSPVGSAILLGGVASLFGLSLGSLIFTYTAASIGLTFVVTSAMFIGLCLFGYITKINLQGIGAAALMLLFGLLAALIANMFFKSTVMDLIISAAGVLIFAAITAWESQKMVSDYHSHGISDSLTAMSNNAALSMYLNFINMFLFLLRFLGHTKD